VGIIIIIITWLILREKRKRRHIEAAAPPAFEPPKEAPFSPAGSQPSGNSDSEQAEQQDRIISIAPPGLRHTVASNNLNAVRSSGNAGAVLMPVSPTSPVVASNVGAPPPNGAELGGGERPEVPGTARNPGEMPS
jgi:hypothetical protein